jgi:cytochrome P450
VNPDRLIARCVLNIISSIIFGKRFGREDQEFEQLIGNVNRFIYEMMDNAPVMFFPPMRFIPYFKRKIFEVLEYGNGIMKFIDQRIDEALSVDSRNESFITSFVEAEGPGFDREQLKYILRDLLNAGSETSSTTLRWALLLMANNQEIQRRLQDEIDSVIPRDKLPSLDDRPRLPYVEATILEIWRNKTIVPLSLPRATLSDVTIEGCFVPAGTTVCRLHFKQLQLSLTHFELP